MRDEITKSQVSEALRARTQEIFEWRLMAEFSPIVNTMINNLR